VGLVLQGVVVYGGEGWGVGDGLMLRLRLVKVVGGGGTGDCGRGGGCRSG